MKSTRSSQRSSKSQAINVDEEGFTDKRCRNCQMRLSLQEIQAFSTPTMSENIMKTNQVFNNTMNIGILCLNCYATIVDKRSKNRRSVERPKIDVAVNAEIVNPPIVTKVVGRANSVKSQKSTKIEPVVIEKKPQPMKNDKKYNRVKTDVTRFVNAAFNGGVFLNGIPGQSI
ncbi:hypothetical protein SteCoe_13771 [Stentor coeruleus]|uniref:Uncharacterized protein n=1 Tax=Stentor coeruleus TaxID=5963 RepID=A0A1R2C7K6_9CILI|nr:hypothetical protein SteCoe_13771 [Stentor coeruleus]